MKKVKSNEFKKALKKLEELNKQRPIDKVTTTNLDIALRMVGITFDSLTLQKIINLVGLIEDKGDEVTIRDITELKKLWR